MHWTQILRQNFTSFDALIKFLKLPPVVHSKLDKRPDFILNLPRRLAEKIPKGTLDDPLARQFLPLLEEKIKTPNFSLDPVHDIEFRKSNKLLQKYEGRTLIITTSACAMHCRYCFRKNFPYETKHPQFDRELKILQEDPSIEEVLLSGGDPLSLPDSTLTSLLQELEKIPHVKRIRFHTRFPMGIPERIDESFLSCLSSIKKQIWFVIHANHIDEFDDDIWNALKKVRQLGIPILHQAVLLSGVNDSVDSLYNLFKGLIDHGVHPYRLHQLDRVQGSSHFEVAIDKGLYLLDEVRKRLSGYAIPSYVQEIAGEAAKTMLSR